jgi:dihydroorotate dehydrogenase electron transfer subunit
MKLIKKPEEISKEHYLLTIEHSGKKPLPGQFISIKVNKGTDPLLRRPFSVFDYYDNTIEVVMKIEGKATSIIRDSALDTNTDITGPFGKGFTIRENSNALLIGGGVGNAPLHYLSKTLQKSGTKTTYIYGSRSSQFIYCRDHFNQCSDDILHMTDDGTEGEKGFVTQKAEKLLKTNKYDVIYICGPTIMMKACADILKKLSIYTEVSLENYFGCGIGICSGCTVKTINGNKRACFDGPVFNVNEIIL